MPVQTVIVLTILLIFPASQMALGEEHQTNSENYLISREYTGEVSETTKIHQTLVRWANSDNPEEFANQFGIPHKEGKVAVYIYLKDAEISSEIISELEIISSGKNIIRAFVTSDELYELEKLDFVTRITPPDIAQTPPIPKVEIPQTPQDPLLDQPPEQIQDQFLDLPQEQKISNLWILVLGGLAIAAIIVIIYRKKL
jgi:hypothetical protein